MMSANKIMRYLPIDAIKCNAKKEACVYVNVVLMGTLPTMESPCEMKKKPSVWTASDEMQDDEMYT